MVKRNEHLTKLNPNYLFPEVHRRKILFQKEHPSARIISLGIGNTTEPIPGFICNALARAAEELSTPDGYSGYGPEKGIEELRQGIASVLYKDRISSDEIFVSDGSKCDIGRLQLLFGSKASIAVQDPTYPVYVDGSVMAGYSQIVYMPCTPENRFFPDLKVVPRTDLIYFCSPNNPTGAAATREQLTGLVAFAKRNRSIIIYDAAYASYIQDPTCPRSIFEIEGAHEVAIETNSFSKIVGFTGVRLGWSVVPKGLVFEDGYSVHADWSRVMTTIFNGASNIVQKGALAILEPKGKEAIDKIIHFYLHNARIIRNALESRNLEVFGGVNAPYVWVRFFGKSSWNLFQEYLEERHLVTTPGVGYGSSGEGFIRFSAFGHREDICEAAKRLSKK